MAMHCLLPAVLLWLSTRRGCGPQQLLSQQERVF
jgi:hypothetical protein